MQKIHIIGLIMIAIAVGVLISMMSDVTEYSNFEQAAASGARVKAVGKLSKDKPMEYNPQKDPNYFSFFMKDDKGVEKKVILQKSKPQDFEMSEQIVVTGKMKGNDFVADEILLKCPSKYKDEEIYLKKEQQKI